jgi:hypothetical protein
MITVYLNDKGKPYDFARLYFIDASIWALKHCRSFQGYEIVDTTDVSMVWDQVAEYKFTDERDVTFFKLTWM